MTAIIHIVLEVESSDWRCIDDAPKAIMNQLHDTVTDHTIGVTIKSHKLEVKLTP